MTQHIDITPRAWSAAAKVVAVEAFAALALAVAAVLTDPLGALLAGIAAAGLAATALRDGLARPTLAVTGDGLAIRPVLRPVTVAWREVVAVRAVDDRRGLARTSALEVELADSLLSVAGRRLGADPHEVAAQVTALRPAAGR